MTLAGFPPMTTLFPKLLVTTAPEATTTLSPNATPGLITACPPIQQLSPIDIGRANSSPLFRQLMVPAGFGCYLPLPAINLPDK